jgi:hypothetical protein
MSDYDTGMPNKTPRERARICRIEAAWTLHPPTRTLLLQMAEEYEAMALRAPEARKTEGGLADS